ncbi:MAG: D-2-hydroxyacid dehydrogenase, partial [Clostridia bacterium]|nr:D-2-hydroxyacid dehydrogenase [Clostridia bacterium]
VLTVHCPLNDSSSEMFNREAFAKCKKGAFFINTARGGVVDEYALKEALESGILSGAAIDTITVEPMREDCVLYGVKNLTITPHIAWSPQETVERLIGIVADNIRCYLKGEPKNKVN